jgi:hypothetical protein
VIGGVGHCNERLQWEEPIENNKLKILAEKCMNP